MWIFPLGNATTHTHTQSIPLYGNATTHTQQSKRPKIQVWTWVSTSQAHKTSFNWRCSKHILIILPDICISAHRIKQIKSRKPSLQATHCHSDWRHGNQKGSTARPKKQGKPRSLLCGWCSLKTLLRKLSWDFCIILTVSSLEKQPCRKVVVRFQMSKEGKIPPSVCFFFFHVDNLALKSLDWGFSVPFVMLRNILTSVGEKKSNL